MSYRFIPLMGLDIAAIDAQTIEIMYQRQQAEDEPSDDVLEQLIGFDADFAPTFEVEGKGYELIDWLTKDCPVKMSERHDGSGCYFYYCGDWDLPNFLLMIRMRW